MKRSALLLALVLYFSAIATCLAEDPSIGTWKLNEAKSMIPAGGMKNATAVYSRQGDSIKCVTDIQYGADKPLRVEWVGKYDGKDYPVIGDPSLDTRSYRRVDEYTFELFHKKNGRVIATGRIVYAKDGKTRTMKVVEVGNDGKKIITYAVFDRE